MEYETGGMPIKGFIELKSKRRNFVTKIMNLKKQKTLIKMLLMMN